MKKIVSLFLALLLTLAVLPVSALASFDDACACIDTAEILSDATELDIYGYNNRLKDFCGAEIAVAVVNTTGNVPIDDYSYFLFNAMGIGDGRKNNGILITVAVMDYTYYVTLGSGAEKIIDEVTLRALLDKYMEPAFSTGKFESAVKKLYNALWDVVYDYYSYNNAGTGKTLKTAIPKANDDFVWFDSVGVLNERTCAEIYFNNAQLYTACGSQIVVAVVDNVRGYDIQDYACAMFTSWKLGNDDTLVLLSVEDDNYNVVCGANTEKIFTAKKINNLLATYLEPYFAAGAYSDGAESIFYAMFDAVSTYYRQNLEFLVF